MYFVPEGRVGRSQARSARVDAQSASAPKGLVPEGRYDRSLARSAWDGAIQNSRPVGYGMIRAGVQVSG
jgi:hypothetical protein